MPSEQNQSISASTIDPDEIARFTAMADAWWDTQGNFAPLHRINPVRVGFLRQQIMRHFDRHGESATPLKNISLLDVGCGGGLISEPMARLGATTTGIDAGLENIKTAALHAQQAGLAIDYRCHSAEELAASGVQYDAVLALEIIEHTANPEIFYQALIQLVKPGGMLILSTLNRTAKSYALGIVAAEWLLRWVPRGTHQWQRFIKPSEMAAALRRHGMVVGEVTGLVYQPLQHQFALNPRDLDVNYLMAATKPA